MEKTQEKIKCSCGNTFNANWSLDSIEFKCKCRCPKCMRVHTQKLDKMPTLISHETNRLNLNCLIS